MIEQWKSHMAFVGDVTRQAHDCKRCKPYCSLFDLLCENRFMRQRHGRMRYIGSKIPKWVERRDEAIPDRYEWPQYRSLRRIQSRLRRY